MLRYVPSILSVFMDFEETLNFVKGHFCIDEGFCMVSVLKFIYMRLNLLICICLTSFAFLD